MRKTGLWTAIIAALAIFGCTNDASEPDPQPEDIPPFVWLDDLFVSEVDEDGITKTNFRTNDVRYWDYEGTTIWTTWGEMGTIFDSRTVRMAKSSGFSGGGYGVVFCKSEHEIEGVETHAMLVVMINNQRQYIIGKKVGGIFIDFGWWKTTPYLNMGAGATNEITIFYDENNQEYCLEINRREIERFSDDNFPVLRSGRNGYIVVITPFDNFPASWININFWEKR